MPLVSRALSRTADDAAVITAALGVPPSSPARAGAKPRSAALEQVTCGIATPRSPLASRAESENTQSTVRAPAFFIPPSLS